MTTNMMLQDPFVKTMINLQSTECFRKLKKEITLSSMIPVHMGLLWDTAIMES